MFTSVLLSTVAVILVTLSSQLAYHVNALLSTPPPMPFLNHVQEPYNAGLSKSSQLPLSLSSLNQNEYTVLSHHPLYPNYSVRVKKSRFCDETVKLRYFSLCDS